MPVMGNQLPTAVDVASTFTIGMGTLATVCLLIAGAALLLARSVPSAGLIKTSSARFLRALAAGALASALFSTSIFMIFFWIIVETSGNYTGRTAIDVNLPIVIYSLLPALATIVIIIDLILLQILLFPSPHRIRRYVAGGQTPR
jgi:hypothetical protein